MGSATNRLWVLDGQSHWTQPLPPMLTKCYGASAVSTGNHLIVAGGLSDEDPLDIVQVYNGHEWMRAQPLPKACYFIKCALDKDKKWYLAAWWSGSGQGCLSHFLRISDRHYQLRGHQTDISMAKTA